MSQLTSMSDGFQTATAARQGDARGRVRLRTVALPVEHGGWGRAEAFAVWALLAARVVPSILYVRARLQINHGGRPSLLPALGSHAAACAAAVVLVYAGLAPRLAVALTIVLLARAAFILSRYCAKITARQVGFAEIGFGLLTVLTLAIGYAFGL
jgi:hypothetical protein